MGVFLNSTPPCLLLLTGDLLINIDLPHMAILANQQVQESFCLCLPSLGLIDMLHYLYMGSGGFNLSLVWQALLSQFSCFVHLLGQNLTLY